MIKKRTRGVPTYIDPKTIFGWRDGMSFNVNAGAADGFIYPKSQRRYDAVFGTELDVPCVGSKLSDLQKQLGVSAQTLLEHACDVLESLESTGKMDEPVMVYDTGDRLYLLHGALRLSCVAEIQVRKPDLFKTIPAMFFEGSSVEARKAMMSYQQEMSMRTRALTLQEQVRAVAYMAESNIEKSEIVRLMRWKKNPWYVDAMFALSKLSDAELERKDDEIRRYENTCSVDKSVSGVQEHPYVAILKDALVESPKERPKRPPPSSSYVSRKGNAAHREMERLCNTLAKYSRLPEYQKLFEKACKITSEFNDLKALAVQAEIEARSASPGR